ncbi:hypothetical protein [Bradyrhizobium sp. sGM-13]|uniref:hypothetical protein n=1 Tax=Bradyrhizobium sp. sGM-13 TaxID=2831781 RepID=UPI001BCC7EEF|nr:hypothetical protein [Bradyrhizobium sp. sGM-13]
MTRRCLASCCESDWVINGFLKNRERPDVQTRIRAHREAERELLIPAAETSNVAVFWFVSSVLGDYACFDAYERSAKQKGKVASVLSNCCQDCWSAEQISRAEEHRGLAVTIKNIVIPLEVEYLQEAAKQRGVSRTRLVRAVMEKVVKEELVADILGDSGVPAEAAPIRYRRFRATQ